jgi:hypothetical protein
MIISSILSKHVTSLCDKHASTRKLGRCERHYLVSCVRFIIFILSDSFTHGTKCCATHQANT